MTFKETIIQIITSSNCPITPQEIRSKIKAEYPSFFGTSTQQLNVMKGHYKDLDHALLAQIYTTVRSGSTFVCDKTQKPMLISLGETLKEKTKVKLKMDKSYKNQPFADNIEGLLKNLKFYYRKSLEVFKDFGGPSLYFHIQAIEAQKSEFLSNRHIEMIYATLASWGMHKMGDPNVTKAKLVDFSTFKNSILNHADHFNNLKELRLETCTETEFASILDKVENIYYNLKVSISEATIVANSKTLAHILPNLIPPIDRQYTIRFFTQKCDNFFTKSGQFRAVNLPRSIDEQYRDFKRYCSKIKIMLDRCDLDLFTVENNSFNTSYPKILDNLIMANVKAKTRPKQNQL